MAQQVETLGEGLETLAGDEPVPPIEDEVGQAHRAGDPGSPPLPRSGRGPGEALGHESLRRHADDGILPFTIRASRVFYAPLLVGAISSVG